MTRVGRSYGRILLALLLLGAIAWLGIRELNDRAGPGPAAVPEDARAPNGTRIKVEVLNGTRTKGLALRATLFLRDRGFDVVGAGNTAERLATVVYDRSGHPDWAARVGRAMAAPVVALPDSSRYLDATVILGADWRAPALPFHP